MDINEIAKKVRGREIKLFLPTKVLNPEERVAGLYVGLNIYLAKIMENVRNENRKELIEYFCETMVYFISIANEKKWLYLLLLNEEQMSNFKSKWHSKSYNSVYLIIQQQINKCYFSHQSTEFVHAWHMLIKFGLVELGISPEEIEDYFNQ